MVEQKKAVNETDYHKGEGHHVPFVIKMVWAIFFVIFIYYIGSFSIPDLKAWLAK